MPEAAWNSKTDGWVLVTFSVNTRGKVENVRVLDSQPPGLFDANVVAAVSDWIYDPADIQGRKVKVQLTQRIEMHWKDYPHNNQQLR
ncbi:MAG: TonB family protein [Pseudomonadales bacterium]|nr:TonB family protein [Pseudomonadales bacterium]